MTSSQPASNSPVDQVQSTAYRNAPQLGHRGLSIVLITMCLVPVITIFALWNALPPVYEGQLDATVTAEELPPAEFYRVDYRERQPYEGGLLVVTNNSEQDWTHLNIQVNKHYQIYDVEPIRAGETAKFELDRFLTRTGARFSLRYNQLKSVRIYARRPTRDRATFYDVFETVDEP